MFAVVEIAGKQYKISPNSQVQVDLLDLEPGKTFEINKILLISDDGTKAEIGMPYLKSTITAKVVEHIKGDKIRVFKFIPKKRHQKTQGHRQKYTLLEISDLK